MKVDYAGNWWNTSLRCPVCDTKIHFREDLKPILDDWQVEELPRLLLWTCTNCDKKLKFDVFVDIERRLEDDI